MSGIDITQFLLYFIIIFLCIHPLGWYMARVYEGKPCGLDHLLGPVERFIYRISGVKSDTEMSWKSYSCTMLLCNMIGTLFIYLIQRMQFDLPLNPAQFDSVNPLLAFNTAISFATNTNWQAYGGESTLSYFTQMTAMTVQNFVSAATGMAIMVALFRGIIRREGKTLGNFWVDFTRSILYILLPLSIILAVALSSQGVIQNFKPYQEIQTLENETQVLPMGPVASQVAIKQLGTNGGGYFNTNSAHPFENPTPLSNLLEMVAILLIPAASCLTFGIMAKDKRHGLTLLVTMFLVLIPFSYMSAHFENKLNPELHALGIDHGGNMEGKETRIGTMNSALWATLTTATSNGSVNSMHDSFTPLGGFVPLWMMHLGEIIFGGVGSGLYGMIMMVIITVFVAGLMVGRTPEYLGKKIEPFEMKMAALSVLVVPLIVLLFAAIASVIPEGIKAINNPGAHGFTEILYAFTSMGNNNGSAFAGINASLPFYEAAGGIVMFIGRYWIAIPALAIAGSLVEKKIVPPSLGTLETHTPLFIILLLGTILIVGALSFFPALALGPLAEHFTLGVSYGTL